MKKEFTSDNDRIAHIYDRMFKKILTLSTRAVIGLINGLFGTEYPPDSTITYNWTEHHDDHLKKTLADTIITVNHSHSYHMEAQMYKDEEIEFRVFDYSYGHALKSRNDADILHFPEPRIIYLYNHENLSDTKEILLDFGTQGTFLYSVPVFKLLEHTTKELSSKNMVILIPFMILKLRDSINKKRTPENMKALQALILDDIINMINENQAHENITSADANKLRSLIQKLYNHLYSHYEEFIEGGLNDMMEEGLVLEADILEAELTEKITKRITQQVTEQVTQEVTEQVTQQVTEQVTRQITEQVTQEVTEQVTQQITEQVTQEVTEQVTQQITEQVTQEVTERANRQFREDTIRKLYAKLKDAGQVAELLELPLNMVQEAVEWENKK
ncbi:hypothetical protein C818_00095 [Lachnospiraceae bacterium MD308]|nr:hypothetical protein C818_00095 [Lachnospiraceae bacterium MD308]MCI8502514.1 hypothetical protein [Dorea sp.]